MLDIKFKKGGIIKERIIRVLLNNPEGKLTKYKIMKITKGSQTWVYDYLNILEKANIIENTKVIDYKKLFDIWINIRKKPQKIEYFIKNPDDLLKKTNLYYALTTYKAENLLQNYLFPSRYDLYIKNENINYWNKLLLNYGLKGKGNFRILIYDNGVFYKSFKINDYRVVSIPQLITDLYVEGGVSVEASEMLFNKYVNKYVFK